MDESVVYLEQQEEERLLGSISTKAITGVRDRALVLTMLDAGLRVSEALGLRWRDVRFKQSDAYPNGMLKVQTLKRRKVRRKKDRVRVSNRLREALQVWHSNVKRPESDWVFCAVRTRGWDPTTASMKDLDARPITRQAVHRMVKDLAKEALGEERGNEITPHVFRHTAGTRMRETGADVKQISTHLRHVNSANTVRFYMGVSPTEMNDAVAAAFDGVQEPQREEETEVEALRREVAHMRTLIRGLVGVQIG